MVPLRLAAPSAPPTCYATAAAATPHYDNAFSIIADAFRRRIHDSPRPDPTSYISLTAGKIVSTIRPVYEAGYTGNRRPRAVAPKRDMVFQTDPRC